MLEWREFGCIPGELSSWLAPNFKTSFNFRHDESFEIRVRYCDGYFLIQAWLCGEARMDRITRQTDLLRSIWPPRCGRNWTYHVMQFTYRV